MHLKKNKGYFLVFLTLLTFVNGAYFPTFSLVLPLIVATLLFQSPKCYTWLNSKVATRDINSGILIKIPQKVELDLP